MIKCIIRADAAAVAIAPGVRADAIHRNKNVCQIKGLSGKE